MSRLAAPAGGPGTSALAEGSRADFRRLRAERLRRLLSAMRETGVDVLVLGRPANIAYASGARQLWTSGARPFGPGCVVVLRTERVHLLSTWDEGVPETIGHDDLFGLSWNPRTIADNLRSIPGIAEARAVATDGYSPGAAALIAGACPSADLVDAEAVLAGARTPRTTDEIACIATAAAVAERALTTMLSAARPGATEREILGAYLRAIGEAGCQVPPHEGVVCATSRRGRPRLHRLVSERTVGPGDLVALNPAAFYGGYAAFLARTAVAGGAAPTPSQIELAGRARASLDAVIAVCKPGATGADLVAEWERTGEAVPPEPIAFGVGLGAEAPLVSAGCGHDAVLAEGQVLAVQAWVSEEGAGGVLEQDTVLVSTDGPVLLTSYPSSLLA